MSSDFSTKDPIGRAKGLGPSHEGTGHWWAQRVTAVTMIPLTIWFAVSLMAIAGQEREFVVSWFGHPFSALALVSVVIVGVYHAVLGLQVVIEDYIHAEWLRLASLWGVRSVGFALMGISLVSVIMMVFMRFMGTN